MHKTRKKEIQGLNKEMTLGGKWKWMSWEKEEEKIIEKSLRMKICGKKVQKDFKKFK